MFRRGCDDGSLVATEEDTIMIRWREGPPSSKKLRSTTASLVVGSLQQGQSQYHRRVLLRKIMKKVSKKVSWGKDESQAIVPTLAEKQQQDEEKAYEEMQQKCMFTVLKSEALEQHVLGATASSDAAAHALHPVFMAADFDSSLPRAERLKAFRETRSINWEMYEADEDKKELLLCLWRTIAIKEQFLWRCREARWNLTDPGVAQDVVRSSNEIPELIASFFIPYQNFNEHLTRRFQQEFLQQAPSVAARLPHPDRVTAAVAETYEATLYPKSSFEEHSNSSPEKSSAGSLLGTDTMGASKGEAESNDHQDLDGIREDKETFSESRDAKQLKAA